MTLRADSTIFALSHDVHGAILAGFRANDDFFAVIDRFQKPYVHRSALEPGRLGVHDGNRHIAVNRHARHQPATKTVLSGHAIVVNFVFRIGRGVFGADAIEGKRVTHALNDRCLSDPLRVSAVDIPVEHVDELGNNMIAPESSDEFAVHVNRCNGLFESAGKRNSDI